MIVSERRTDGRTDRRRDGRTDRRMKDGRGRTDGQTDGRTEKQSQKWCPQQKRVHWVSVAEKRGREID